MTLHNNYMENLRRSKGVVLDLLEDTKEIFEGIFVDDSPTNDTTRRREKETPNSVTDLNLEPSTSKQDKKSTEFVKYGKITFDTTAILHHYPQNCKENKPCNNHCASEPIKVTKKSLNKIEDKNYIENNNDVKSNNKEIKIDISETKDNLTNNNDSVIKLNSVVKADNTVTVLQKPVKFTEEKLV